MRDGDNVTVELLPELRAESEVGEMIERCVAEEAESLLRDMQEYRGLSDRIRSMFGDAATLKDVVDSLERKLLEPGKPDPVNARILTYEESAMWDAYRAIGTPEECREAVEKQTGKKPTAVLGIFGGTENECKNCGNDVRYRDEYCRWCGQKLDWSDGE